MLSTRFYFIDKEYSYIGVSTPIICGIKDNNNFDIDNFPVDTIKLCNYNISKNDKNLIGIIYEISHSEKLESGIVISLKNTSYKEYIYLLDAFISNKIFKIKYDEDCAYYFPNKSPTQVEMMQTLFINLKDIH
jgi:hypothetical protein